MALSEHFCSENNFNSPNLFGLVFLIGGLPWKQCKVHKPQNKIYGNAHYCSHAALPSCPGSSSLCGLEILTLGNNRNQLCVCSPVTCRWVFVWTLGFQIQLFSKWRSHWKAAKFNLGKQDQFQPCSQWRAGGCFWLWMFASVVVQESNSPRRAWTHGLSRTGNTIHGLRRMKKC